MHAYPENRSCKSFFKNGSKPTKEEYTAIWIDMINQIESKNTQLLSESSDIPETTDKYMGMPDSDRKDN